MSVNTSNAVIFCTFFHLRQLRRHLRRLWILPKALPDGLEVSSPLAPHLPAPVHDHTLFKQRDVRTFAHCPFRHHLRGFEILLKTPLSLESSSVPPALRNHILEGTNNVDTESEDGKA
jgi:hypothetical protein